MSSKHEVYWDELFFFNARIGRRNMPHPIWTNLNMLWYNNMKNML